MIGHVEQGPPSLPPGGLESVARLVREHGLVKPRAYAAFGLHVVSSKARAPG